MENTSISVILNWNFTVGSIFDSVLYLGDCPEMFTSKHIFKDWFVDLVNVKKGNTSIKLYFHVIDILWSKSNVKKFKKYLKTCVQRFSILDRAVGIDGLW